MGIEGEWFMQPGDDPAPFVFPLVLHPDGRAEWPGKRTVVEPYRVAEGLLVIGQGAQRKVFRLPANEESPEWLSGDILNECQPDEDDEDYDLGPMTLMDAAVLLRRPADHEIVEYGVADTPSDDFPTADVQPNLI